MVWSLRPEMAGMVDRMITTAYQRSKLPATEREVARMRIAQLNDCARARPSARRRWSKPASPKTLYEHLDEWRT